MDSQPADTSVVSMMTMRELASYLGVSIATIRNWRAKGVGPPRYRFGDTVRYRTSEVDAWLETQQEPAA